MTSEATFATKGRNMATVFASIHDDLSSWYQVYFDRGYTLTDADVAEAGVPAADVVGLVTFVEALNTFMVTNGGYISKMRNDL